MRHLPLPLGKTFRQGNDVPNEIIGVVPDFSLSSMERLIEPGIYELAGADSPVVSVKLTGRDIPETLSSIDKIWAATGANGPIDRFFLDAYIQDLYRAMLREARGFVVFSGIAVLLACLGLIGLSVSMAERRTKEIGIRKAMGAKTRDILLLLNWEFVKPVLWGEPHRLAGGVLFHEPMACRLCLSHRFGAVDVLRRWSAGPYHRASHGVGAVFHHRARQTHRGAAL